MIIRGTGWRQFFGWGLFSSQIASTFAGSIVNFPRPLKPSPTTLLPTLSQPAQSPAHSFSGKTNWLAQQAQQLGKPGIAKSMSALLPRVGQQAIYAATQQMLHHWFPSAVTAIHLPFPNLKQAEITCLFPLFKQPQFLNFIQFAINNLGTQRIVHAGVGQRYFTSQKMWGYNLFLDHDQRWHHLRGSLGIEANWHHGKINANYYFPLTGWCPSLRDPHYDERPARGADLWFHYFLPSIPRWSSQLGWEYYQGQKVALSPGQPQQTNPYRLTLGINYQITPYCTLGVDYRLSSPYHYAICYKLLFTGWIGRDASIYGHSTPSYYSRHHPQTMFVKRANHIVFAYHSQPSLQLTLPSSVSGESEQSLVIQPQINSKYPLSHLEWQADDFKTAGGRISSRGSLNYQIQLPRWKPTGNNRYLLRVIAYNHYRQRSQPAECQIIVTPTELSGSPLVTAKSAPPPSSSATDFSGTVLAENLCDRRLGPLLQDEPGRWYTTLYLTLRDPQQQPFTGLASQIAVKSQFYTLTADSRPLSIAAWTENTPGEYRTKISVDSGVNERLWIKVGKHYLSPTEPLHLILPSQVSIILKAPQRALIDQDYLVTLQATTDQGTPAQGQVEITASHPSVTITGSPVQLNDQGQGVVTIRSTTPIDAVTLTGTFNKGRWDWKKIGAGTARLKFYSPFQVTSIIDPQGQPLNPQSLKLAAWSGAQFTINTEGLPAVHWSSNRSAALDIVSQSSQHATFKFTDFPKGGEFTIGGVSEAYEKIFLNFSIREWKFTSTDAR